MMQMRVKTGLFGLLAAAGFLSGAAELSENTLIRLPPMACAPTIDGRVSREEMRACSVGYGAVSQQTGLLALRPVVFHFGYTAEGFYFAVRASRPVPPQKYTDADRATLLLLPPGARNPVRVDIPLAEGTVLKGVHDYGVECVEVERLVKYAALGVKAPRDGEKWGLQMSVGFGCAAETGLWHFDKDGSSFGMFVPDAQAPVASLMNLAPLDSWRTGSTYTPEFRVRNATTRPVKVVSKSFLYGGVGESKLDNEAQEASCHQKFEIAFSPTVKPGESFVRYARPPFPIWPGSVNTLAVDISAGEPATPVCRRRFSWDLDKGLNWKDEVGLPYLKAAFYPSKGNLLRAKWHPNKIATLVKAGVIVTDANGKRWLEKAFKGDPYLKTGEFIESLGELPLGDYRVRFAAVDEKGTKYTDEDTFTVAKFPWQGLELGKDRVIVPPFKPIRVESEKISFLQTGYKCGGVLWDEVYAKDENILAAPVGFVLNGKRFVVKDAKVLECAADRVVREVTAECDGLALTVLQTYDYDGFCDVRLKFVAGRPVEVKSLVLEMPLKEKYVSLFNTTARANSKRATAAPDFTLPQGEGVVWSCDKTGYAVDQNLLGTYLSAYVWLGGPERGLCWMIDSVRDMSIEKGSGPQRIVRRDGAVVFESDYVNKPTVWTGEKSFRMGFQPSPVKPQGEGYASLAQHMYTYLCPSNATKLAMTGIFAPKMWPLLYPVNSLPGGDDSLLRYMVGSRKLDKPDFHRRVRAYAEKHRAWFEENSHETADSFVRDMEIQWRKTGCDCTLDYMNPTINSCHWPEWEAYKSEWTIFEWYERNEINEYHCNVVPSRIDKLLYDARTTLGFGIKGIYYDCFEQFRDWNFVMDEAAFRLPDGSVRNAVNRFFQWRDLAKRTATLSYLNDGMLFGRPCVEVHATSFQVLPILSFCSTALLMERGSQGGEFQERYNESYLLTDITGRQSGAVPRLIVTTTAGDNARRHRELKSLFGLMCAIGVFALNDQGIVNADWFDKAWNTVFDAGWGKPDSEMHWYYDGKPQPVTYTGKNVRVNVCKRGNAALLAFGNFGDAETVSFDATGLGFGATAVAEDAETGLAVDAARLAVARHGYRLVRIRRK